MELIKVNTKDAKRFFDNDDFVSKALVKGLKRKDLIATLDNGLHLGVLLDGELACIVQVELQNKHTASLHGYVPVKHRKKAQELYLFVIDRLAKNNIKSFLIYCNRQVRNFAIKRLGFKEHKQTTHCGEKFFVVIRK